MAVRSRTDFIVLHVSATPPSRDIGAAEINAMHKAKGWKGIGYHFVMRRGGVIETGRAVNQVGAHVEGWNSVSIGICLVGGIDEHGRAQDNRTDAQNAALLSFLPGLLKSYPHAKICGHRDLSPDRNGNGRVDRDEFLKECPCFDVIPWARAHGLPAADIKGYWDQAAPALATLEPPDSRKVYLQKLLVRAGYDIGPIDGHIGPRTAKAIMMFQYWAGLPQSGTFDPKTVQLLRERFEQAPAA